MPRYKKHDLLEIVIEAIKDSGWNLLFVSRFEKHPFLVRIFKEEKSYLLRIYIWNLTHGGGTKRPADEYRIQITGIDHFERNKGEKTLILGWWDDAQVFAGFDYTKHSGKLGFSPSIQIRENALRKAHIHGIASHNKGNGEIAVAFRPDFFVNYVEELEEIHKFADSDVDYEILEKLFEEPEQVNDETIKKVSKFRRSQILKIKKKIRDSSFKSRVLNAYGHRCAYCSIQLSLVEAAHILPVSYFKSTDETKNGIALCPLHHRAYDKALITMNEKYQIVFNNEEFDRLKKIGHDGELNRFINNIKPYINVPPAVKDRPHVDYIIESNKIRGWELYR